MVILSIYTGCACSPRSNSHEHLLALEVITQLSLCKSVIYFVITEIYSGKWLLWNVNLFLYSVVQNRTNITNLQISKQCFYSDPHSVLSWNNSGDFKWKGTWVKAGLPLCTLWFLHPKVPHTTCSISQPETHTVSCWGVCVWAGWVQSTSRPLLSSVAAGGHKALWGRRYCYITPADFNTATQPAKPDPLVICVCGVLTDHSIRITHFLKNIVFSPFFLSLFCSWMLPLCISSCLTMFFVQQCSCANVRVFPLMIHACLRVCRR